MSKKKNFEDSSVLAFIQSPREEFIKPHTNGPDDVPDNAHNVTHDMAHKKSQSGDIADSSQENLTHDEARNMTLKKTRINLNIDSPALYDRIYIQAERQGKSVTRYINDLILSDIARADYLDSKKKGGKK